MQDSIDRCHPDNKRRTEYRRRVWLSLSVLPLFGTQCCLERFPAEIMGHFGMVFYSVHSFQQLRRGPMEPRQGQVPLCYIIDLPNDARAWQLLTVDLCFPIGSGSDTFVPIG